MPFMGIDTITLLTTVFWIWMLIDCLFHKRIKYGWFIFIFFTHIVGAVIYFFLACSNRNPVDALAYYIQRLTGIAKPPKSKFVPPKPRKPSPQAPITYTPYQHGYQSQSVVPIPPPVYQEVPPLYDSQSEYEQPTTTYPQMPPQQMH